MWNYSFILPSLLILAIIQCFYYSYPRLSVRTNKIFQMIILSDCLVLLFDLLSTRADADYSAHSQAMLYFLNMGFFVLYLARIYSFYAFTTAALHLPHKKLSAGFICSASVFLISEIITLSSFFTGAVFSIQADGYHSGPLYNLIYICFLFYILYSIVLLIRFRGRISTHQFVSALAAQLVLLAGNLVRFLFPHYIVMNMFCLLAIFILFLGFQNPSLYRAIEGNAFNLEALREVLRENEDEDDFCIFAFTIKYYADVRELYGRVQVDKGIALICQYMSETFPKQQLYYLGSGGFAVTGADEMEITAMHKKLLERFKEPWISDTTNLYLRAGYVYLKLNEKLNTTDKMIDCLYGALREAYRSDIPDDEIIGPEFYKKLESLTEIKRALDDAIKTQSVEVYLMPIVDAHSRKLKYAEALSRIRGKDGQIIPPALFIPLAERNGQINDIGSQVLDRVCEFISKNHPEDWGMEWINVNLSPVQFLDRNLCREFCDILKKYDVRPDQIHLEITEQSTSNVHELMQQIDSLTEAGFKLSLDDYGKGYSNLSRLSSLPFADIKIDMDVVWDYCRKRDILLPSLITTLKKLGFTVTAEGIETEEIADLMCEIGCDYLQGFLFSEPVPMEQCTPARH